MLIKKVNGGGGGGEGKPSPVEILLFLMFLKCPDLSRLMFKIFCIVFPCNRWEKKKNIWFGVLYTMVL